MNVFRCTRSFPRGWMAPKGSGERLQSQSNPPVNHALPSVWVSVREHRLAADLKATGNFLLGRADDLHLVPKPRAHSLCRQFRRIAVATEVPKHRATELPFEEFAEDTGSSGVRKMAMPRHDALFDAPWALGAGLQEFLIVIRLDDDSVRGADSLVHELGGKPEIREKSKGGATMVENEADRLHRIVGDRERLDIDVADTEIAAGDEQPPILRHALIATQRLGREAVAIDGRLEVFAPDIETAAVVTVLVGEEDSVDLQWITAARAQALESLLRTQATIDQQPGLRRFHQRAVSGAATAEDGEVKHVREL